MEQPTSDKKSTPTPALKWDRGYETT